MSTNMFESLRNVKTSRADWKVKVRVIRQWKSSNNTGVVFKEYNLLLLDAKKCRMHAFVPESLTEKMTRIIEEGKIYLIKNFTVKDYTEKDKYRVVHMDRQIVFTSETKVKELDETDIFIPNNSFDLFEYSDLKEQAQQVTYLTDIIGIVQTKGNISRIPGKKVRVSLKITDGRKNVNVTFWNEFDEVFEEAMSQELEEPVIIIIASAKVSMWQDQIDICNYAPTRYYLNYEHHSVAQLRKRIGDPNFSAIKVAKLKKKVKHFNIIDILSLDKEYNQEEVICKGTIQTVEDITEWKRHICTSCYGQTYKKDDLEYCVPCKRIVPYLLKRFHVSTMVADHTGKLKAVLRDREIRNLIHKYVQEVENEDNSLPKEIKAIVGMQCTLKLLVTANNVEEKSTKFLATHVIKGFIKEDDMTDQGEKTETTEISAIQESGQEIHLDDISQMQSNN